MIERLRPPVSESDLHSLARLLVDAVESGAVFLVARDAAERLYRRLGWTTVGTIPRFALDPDGVTPHDAVVFYKELLA